MPETQKTDLIADKVLAALQGARTRLRTLESQFAPDAFAAAMNELGEAIGLLDAHNPDADDFYYWDVRFGVHKGWVADGADFTDERALDMLGHTFKWANMSSELRATVLRRPSDRKVATEQGYKSVADYIHTRGE